jgi:hypothetical protein
MASPALPVATANELMLRGSCRIQKALRLTWTGFDLTTYSESRNGDDHIYRAFLTMPLSHEVFFSKYALFHEELTNV